MPFKEQDTYKLILKKIELGNLNLELNSPEKLKQLLININKFMTKRLEDSEGEDCLRWFLKTMKKYQLLLTIMNLYSENSSTYKEELIKKLNKYSHKTILHIIDEALLKKYIIYKKSNDKKKKLIEPSVELLIAYMNWNIKHVSNYSDAVKKIID
jgi:hypothetical protein